MKISIVILTKNGEKTIDKCLGAIFKQKYNEEFEIIVIDSGSTDSTLSIIQKYPVILKTIPPQEFHHARTRNLGRSLAKGEIVVYLSQDAEPLSDDWLYELTKSLCDDSKICAVYGKQIPRKDSSPLNDFRMRWLYGDELNVKEISEKSNFKRQQLSFSNANSATRKEVLERFPFRKDISFAEDIDFSSRALLAGYKIAYAPKAAVYHAHDYTIIEIFRRYFDVQIAYNRIGISRDMRGLFGEGVRYVLKELQFLWQNKHFILIPYSLIYNSAKYTGLRLGTLEKIIPMPLKRRISRYWYRDYSTARPKKI